MERTNTDHIAAAKAAYGNPQMSDRELGERLGGFSQQSIGHAKAGNMSDHIAVSIGKLLEETQGIDAGIVVLVARALREKNEEVRNVMMRFAGKTQALMAKEAAQAEAFAAMRAGDNQSGLCIM